MWLLALRKWWMARLVFVYYLTPSATDRCKLCFNKLHRNPEPAASITNVQTILLLQFVLLLSFWDYAKRFILYHTRGFHLWIAVCRWLQMTYPCPWIIILIWQSMSAKIPWALMFILTSIEFRALVCNDIYIKLYGVITNPCLTLCLGKVGYYNPP